MRLRDIGNFHTQNFEMFKFSLPASQSRLAPAGSATIRQKQNFKKIHFFIIQFYDTAEHCVLWPPAARCKKENVWYNNETESNVLPIIVHTLHYSFLVSFTLGRPQCCSLFLLFNSYTIHVRTQCTLHLFGNSTIHNFHSFLSLFSHSKNYIITLAVALILSSSYLHWVFTLLLSQSLTHSLALPRTLCVDIFVSISLTMLKYSRTIRNYDFCIFRVCNFLWTNLLVPLHELQNKANILTLKKKPTLTRTDIHLHQKPNSTCHNIALQNNNQKSKWR